MVQLILIEYRLKLKIFSGLCRVAAAGTCSVVAAALEAAAVLAEFFFFLTLLK